jgi:hypothetical protein
MLIPARPKYMSTKGNPSHVISLYVPVYLLSVYNSLDDRDVKNFTSFHGMDFVKVVLSQALSRIQD